MELRLALAIKNLTVGGQLVFLFSEYLVYALICGTVAYFLYKYYRKHKGF